MWVALADFRVACIRFFLILWRGRYDLYHVNTVPMWELKRQLVALNILPAEDNSGDDEELDEADDGNDELSAYDNQVRAAPDPWLNA